MDPGRRRTADSWVNSPLSPVRVRFGVPFPGTSRTGAARVKALVKEKAEPGLWLKDVPEPQAGPGEVLIKVLRTGICGTDLHIRNWDGWAQQTITTPLV